MWILYIRLTTENILDEISHGFSLTTLVNDVATFTKTTT